MSLIVQEISNEIMHWNMQSRKEKKNRGWGLQISGPHLPSMHYLVEFNKAVVVVVSIFRRRTEVPMEKEPKQTCCICR